MVERKAVDVRRVDAYQRAVSKMIRAKRAWLVSVGFDPNDPKDRPTCEWLVWHLTKCL